MVRSAMPELPLADIDLLVIENVGNLVCPAEFRVGEDMRVMVSAVTEGEDKPLKYPLMFRACDLVIVNKIDLLPHLDVSVERLARERQAVHPGVPTMLVSARTGEGIDEHGGSGSPRRREERARRRRLEHAGARGAQGGCTPQGYPFFPRTAPWYQDVSRSPVDTQSAAVVVGCNRPADGAPVLCASITRSKCLQPMRPRRFARSPGPVTSIRPTATTHRFRPGWRRH